MPEQPGTSQSDAQQVMLYVSTPIAFVNGKQVKVRYVR